MKSKTKINKLTLAPNIRKLIEITWNANALNFSSFEILRSSWKQCFSLTMQSKTFNFSKHARNTHCTLDCSSWIAKSKMLKTFHHLKFLEAPKSVALHRWFKVKIHSFLSIQIHIGLFKLDYKNTYINVHSLHFTVNAFMPLKKFRQWHHCYHVNGRDSTRQGENGWLVG